MECRSSINTDHHFSCRASGFYSSAPCRPAADECWREYPPDGVGHGGWRVAHRRECFITCGQRHPCSGSRPVRRWQSHKGFIQIAIIAIEVCLCGRGRGHFHLANNPDPAAQCGRDGNLHRGQGDLLLSNELSATVDSDYTLKRETLTFTPSNWETEQAMTITIVDDAVAEPAEIATVFVFYRSDDPAFNSGQIMRVTITDNDTRGVTLSQTALTVDEGGATTYTVVLDSEPTGAVTVTPFGQTLGLPLLVDPSTFTPDNWNTPQTVTVTAEPKHTCSSRIRITLCLSHPHSMTFIHLVSGGDYDSVIADLVEVTLIDTTTPFFSVSGPSSVGEDEVATYMVSLNAEPLLDMTVDYATEDGTATAGSDYTAASGTLTFTRASWNTPQSVPVMIIDDEMDDDGEIFTFKLSNPSSGTVLSENRSVTTTIMEATPSTKEKLDEVNEEVAPSVLNEVTAKQVAMITGRLETISSGSPMGSLSMEEVVTDVADYLLSHHQDIQTNGFDWRQALSGNRFSFALADISVSQSRMEDSKSSSSSSGPVSFWGAIDYSSLEDKIEGFDLDGDITSFSLGVDKEFRSDLVAGVLLSIANSEFDLTEGSTDSTYEVDIATVNPYMSWEASEDLSLWASVGYGRGQADLTDDSTNDTVSKSGDFTRFSAGGHFQLWQSEAGTALALKLDGTTAHFLEADMQNSRLATELSHGFSIESGVLNTALELGLLMSSADESAAELAGRLHWQGDAGFSASARSRVLLGGGDRNQWGIGGALRYTTSGAGEGLMMSLEPSFGISNPRLLSDLWSATRSDLAITTEAPTARLNAKLAYGFPSSDGLLTPYTDLSFSETTSTYATGLRYGLPTGLDLDLKGMRKTSATDAAENTILLELRSDL